MKIRHLFVILFLLTGVCDSICQTAFNAENLKLKVKDTIGAVSFTNITKRSNECVMISGSSAFKNNFFVDSCIDRWNVKETASVGYVHDLHYVNADNGWMILSSSVVRLENDRLVEKKLENIDNSDFNRILFVNEQRGWAIGENGKIISTEDGDLSWLEQNSQTNFDLEDIVFSSLKDFWVIGSKYTDGGSDLILLRTDNGGEKWNTIEQATGKKFVKIFFSDSRNGWAIDENSNLSITKNGGLDWKRKINTEIKFTDIYFLNANIGWGIDDKSVFYTNNGGKTWISKKSLPDINPYNFSKIIFLDKNNGWLYSEEKILQTKNGGTSWQNLDFDIGLSKEFIK